MDRVGFPSAYPGNVRKEAFDGARAHGRKRSLVGA
jgi:hypothetical protein